MGLGVTCSWLGQQKAHQELFLCTNSGEFNTYAIRLHDPRQSCGYWPLDSIKREAKVVIYKHHSMSTTCCIGTASPSAAYYTILWQPTAPAAHTSENAAEVQLTLWPQISLATHFVLH